MFVWQEFILGRIKAQVLMKCALLCQPSPNAKCHRKSCEHNRHKNTSVIFFFFSLTGRERLVFCLYLDTLERYKHYSGLTALSI